jgi:O-antigen/teichoic acid export membrane protein
MSVVKTVGTGVAWNSTGMIAGKILIVTNVLIILSHLTVYDYGLTELVMSAVSMGSLALLSGLTSIVTVDLGVERAAGELGRMKSTFLQFLSLNISIGILLWAIFFFGSTYVAQLVGNPVVEPFLTIVSFSFLISPFRTASTVLAAVYLRYADQAAYGVVEEVWKALLLVILLVWLNLGPKGLLIAFVLSQLLTVLSFSWRTRSAYLEFGHAAAVDPSAFWKLVRHHRLWGIGVSYIGTMSQNFRIWIIKLMLGTEAVGLFAFAYGLYGNLIGLLPLSSVLTPLYPHYLNEKDRLARMVRISAKAQLALGIAMCACALIAAPLFVHLFFPKFGASIPVLLVLLIALIPSSVATVITPVFAAFKEQRSLFSGTVFKAAIMLICIVPCIMLFGVTGAAVEILITTIAATMERYIRVKAFIPRLSLGYRSLLSLGTDERRILSLFMQRPSMARLREVLLDFK